MLKKKKKLKLILAIEAVIRKILIYLISDYNILLKTDQSVFNKIFFI